MEDAIKNFGKQFNYVPEIVNRENLEPYKHIILLGMGGSHLAAGIVKEIDPTLSLYIHKDYGLPEFEENVLRESLIIASSYSGNTEEVVEGLNLALSKGLNSAVISVGGKLIEIAKEKKLPFIQLPDTGVQPRSALGFSFIALAYLLDHPILIPEIEGLVGRIEPLNLKEEGKRLAENLKGFVPIIYTSNKHLSICYNWKIKFNETGKIPAFYNVFPELNHNEMTGFDINGKNKSLSENFTAIFLTDKKDHSQIQKRMKITKKLYEDRGLKTIWLELEGETAAELIFNSLILADWAAFYTAEANGSEANEVPMVEEFKKLVS